MFKSILLQIFFYIFCTSSYPFLRQTKDSILLDYNNYNSYQPHGKGSYSFGYEIEDPETQNIQFRDEERNQNGTIVGSYGWVMPDGNIIIVRYIADKNGYRSTVENYNAKIIYEKPPGNFNAFANQSSGINKAFIFQNDFNQQVQEQRVRPISQLNL